MPIKYIEIQEKTFMVFTWISFNERGGILKYVVKVIPISIIAVVLLAGCTNLKNDEQSNAQKAAQEYTKEIVTMSEATGGYRKMGENIKSYDVECSKKGEIISSKAIQEYKVNSAKIYDGVLNSDIDESKLMEADYNWELSYEHTKFVTKEEIIKSKILICDVSVKNIDGDEHNITDLSLVYKNKKNQMLFIGYPVYFSGPKENKIDGNDYVLLKGQTMEAKIAWILDSDISGVQEYDLDRVYLATGFDGLAGIQEYVKLDIKDEKNK